MNIVTLTTDYGCRDYYAGALKSKLLQVSENIHLVDITHEIEPFHVGAAAYQVRQAMKFFPPETIHFIDVSYSYDEKEPFLLVRFASQYFCACDTGVFSLILDGAPPEFIRRLYVTDLVKHASFPAIDLFPAVLYQVIRGESLDHISEPFESLQSATELKPVFYERLIRASVLHIDNYENIILNVTKDEFERARRGRNFIIHLRRGVETDRILETYAQGSLRDVTALFNVNNYLELSLHKANLASLNNLNVGDQVQIDFL